MRIRSRKKMTVSPSGCWEWQGARTTKGYGTITLGRKSFYVHRLMFELLNGDPGKLLVCHHCDNPSCFNPDHLFLGTSSDNQKDAFIKGRHKPPPSKGEKNGFAKLDEEKVQIIRDLHDGGFSNKEIAKYFDVTPENISSILTGKTWK